LVARPILRAWAPTVAVPLRTTRPTMVIMAVEITMHTGTTDLPVLIAIVTPRNVLIVATLWLLGLADGIRSTLNRQVVARLRRRPTLPVRIMLRTVLPLAALPLILAVVFELTAVVAANNLILQARLIVFWSR